MVIISLWFYPSWWQHAANLASYEQQDAHEFFISMLDGIHEKVEKDRRKPQSQGAFCPVPVSFYHFFMSRLCACYVKLGGVFHVTKRAIKRFLSLCNTWNIMARGSLFVLVYAKFSLSSFCSENLKVIWLVIGVYGLINEL
jgi:hypothetical protein